MNYPNWTKYMYDIHEYIRQQETVIETLMKRVNQLEENLQNAKSNKIEKIEYHFDQLKIERLDGTLHIGLSPQDLANLEDTNFINQANLNQANSPNYSPPFKQTIQAELSAYLQQTGPSIIHQLAVEHNVRLDDGYPSILIQDIEKQLPGRIAFYENEAYQKKIHTQEELHAFITDKIKAEIHQSLKNYMQNNHHKGE
jgi:spore germination protein PC